MAKLQRINPCSFPFKAGEQVNSTMTVVGTHYAQAVVSPTYLLTQPNSIRRYYLACWNKNIGDIDIIGEIKLTDYRNPFKASVSVPALEASLVYRKEKLKYLNLMTACKRLICRSIRSANEVTYVIRAKDPKNPNGHYLSVHLDGTMGLFIPSKSYQFKSVIHARIHAQWLKARLPETSANTLHIYSWQKQKTYAVEGQEKQIELMTSLIGGYAGDFKFTKAEKENDSISSDPFHSLI